MVMAPPEVLMIESVRPLRVEVVTAQQLGASALAEVRATAWVASALTGVKTETVIGRSPLA